MIRATMMVVAMALTACAGTSKQAKSLSRAAPLSAAAQAAAEQEKKDQAQLVCVWERPTGSNIPEKVCRMPEQVADQRAETQRVLLTLPPAVNLHTGG